MSFPDLNHLTLELFDLIDKISLDSSLISPEELKIREALKEKYQEIIKRDEIIKVDKHGVETFKTPQTSRKPTIPTFGVEDDDDEKKDDIFTPSTSPLIPEIITISDDEDELLAPAPTPTLTPGANSVFDTQSPLEAKIYRVLKEKYGHSQFRPRQMETILSIVENNNVLSIMPTGYGKSTLYQIPSLIQNGFSLVIQPLVSLITDQVLGLKRKSIKCEYFSGKFSKTENSHTMRRIRLRKDIKFVFVTPEKIMKSKSFYSFLQDMVRQKRVNRFVIDEAHCISTWGFDFRTDYRQLTCLRDLNVPILMLTGTATDAVEKDLVNTMKRGYSDIWKVFRVGLNRKNLKYSVKVLKKGQKKEKEILAFLTKKNLKNSTGIVYCFSRNDCEELSKKLKRLGLNCDYYHSKVPSSQKDRVHKNWLDGRIRVIVATTAFGMGVDHPTVRFVVHHTLPKSVFEYYQQSGRAGRDGKNSYCQILYFSGDPNRVKRITNHKNEYERLEKMKLYCENKKECRRKAILRHFGENIGNNVCKGGCDVCKNRNKFTFDVPARIEKKVRKDFTDHAKNMIYLINEVSHRKTGRTANYLKKVYRGSKSIDIKKTFGDHTKIGYGKGKKLSGSEVSMLIDELKTREFVLEDKVSLRKGAVFFNLRVTDLGNRFTRDGGKLFLYIRVKDNPGKKKKKRKDKKKERKKEGLKKYEKKLSKEALKVIKEKNPQSIRDLQELKIISDKHISKYGYSILKDCRKKRKISVDDERKIKFDLERFNKSMSLLNSDNFVSSVGNIRFVDLTEEETPMKKKRKTE